VKAFCKTELRRNNRGQALIELTFIAPLLIILAFGAIEVGSVISTYLTLTHLTREGANLASRGGSVPIDRSGANNDILDAIITASAPTLATANQAHWRVIYSKLVQDPGSPCPPRPCKYIVDTRPGGRFTRGTLNQQSKLGSVNGVPIPYAVLPGLEDVEPGQTFHVFEVFYNYAPYIVTFIGRGIRTDLYDRTVFTNVSGS
jgi:hypothetical protein